MINRHNTIIHATARQRLYGGIVFVCIATFFTLALLTACGKINLWPFPCSFQQQYELPCPTCGMTTAVSAFVRGRIWDSFLLQPAAPFLCMVLLLSGFLAFLTACFGVYFSFLNRFFEEVKIRHIVVALLFILAAGWAVALARSMAINK